MKLNEGSFNPENKLYLDMMVGALNKHKKPSTRKNDATPEEIRAIQSPSTQSVMDRPKELDGPDYWYRPITSAFLANTTAKNQDELVGKKDFDPTQVAIIEDIRRKARNTLGQPTKEGFSAETKERAVHAFTYSKPAELTSAQVMEAYITEMNKVTKHIPTISDLIGKMEKKKDSDWWFNNRHYFGLIIGSFLALILAYIINTLCNP